MNYTITTNPTFATLADGMTLTCRFSAESQGNDTLNVNATGTWPLVKITYSGISTPLVAGDILANQLAIVIWNNALSQWVYVTDPFAAIPANLDVTTLTASGLITASGGITTASIAGDPSFSGGLTVPSGQTATVAGTLDVTGTTDVGTLTASGLITANGGISVPSGQTEAVAGTLSVTGTLDVTGTITIPNATLPGQAVNLGQSLSGGAFRNVTASRALNTVYTNSSGRPMEVLVTMSSTGGAYFQGAISGNIFVGAYVPVAGLSFGGSFIVPPGDTYSILTSNGTLTSWYEIS